MPKSCTNRPASAGSGDQHHDARRVCGRVYRSKAFAAIPGALALVQLSSAIAWRTATLEGSLARRLGKNDAWIAATALSCEATLVAREKAFERVPRLDYLTF